MSLPVTEVLVILSVVLRRDQIQTFYLYLSIIYNSFNVVSTTLKSCNIVGSLLI